MPDCECVMVSLMVKIVLYAKFNTRLWMRDGESDGKDYIIC